MIFNEIIETVNEIVNNPKIYKKGLSLVYVIPSKVHRGIDEHLYHKNNPNGNSFEHREVIEIEIDGFVIRFITSDTEIDFKSKKEEK